MNRQAAATYCRNAGATDFSDLFWVTWTFKSHGWMFTSIRHQLFIHFIQLFISQIPWSSVTLEPLDLDGFKAVSWHEHHVTRTWHAQIKTCDRTSRTYHVRSRNNSLFKDRTVLKYIYICTYKDAWICGTLKPQNNDKTGFFQHFTKKKMTCKHMALMSLPQVSQQRASGAHMRLGRSKESWSLGRSWGRVSGKKHES